MPLAQKELVILQHFLSPLPSPFLRPMRHPSRIDFPAQQEPFLLEFPHSVLLFLLRKVIDTDIGALPMTFMNIFNPIHIVFGQRNVQIFPHLPDFFHIALICAVEPVLILDLEHNDAAFWVALCAHVFPDDGYQSLEVDFGLSEEDLVICPQFDARSIQKPSRHASEIPFRTDIRSRPEKHHHFMLLCQFQKESQIFIASLEIELSTGSLMIIPDDVDTQGIQAESLYHQDPVLPVLDGNSGVVDFACVDWQES